MLDQVLASARRLILASFFGLTFLACTMGGGERQVEFAEELYRQGKFLSAIEEYSKVVNYGQRSPLALKAQEQIATIYEQNLKDFSRAIRAYRDLHQRADDKKVKFLARRAIARIYQDQLDSAGLAAEEFQGIIAEFGLTEPDSAEILLTWSKSLMDAGRFKDACEVLGSFRKNFPGNKDGPRALFDEGQALLADRRPDEAKPIFQEIIARFGGQASYSQLVSEAYYGLGNANEMRDDLEAALVAYRQSLSTYPNRDVIELKIRRVEQRKKERRL